jgi:phosphotransferase system enzyme I (PtsI)
MKGIGVSSGIAIGRAFVIQKKEASFTGILLTTPAEKEAAITQFDMATVKAIAEVEQIKNSPSLSEEDSAILDAQIELLSDPEIRDNVIDKIEGEDKNANDALLDVIAGFIGVFESMDDEYMQARAADVKDIGHRILRNLQSAENKQTVFEPNTILIAEDLSPSDTITLDVKNITGFATQVGSQTSHAAIIAKAKGIPAVVGCGAGLTEMKSGDIIILDGTTGQLLINPNQEQIDEYRTKRDAFKKYAEQLKSLKDTPAITTDGSRITLSANISNAGDWPGVFENGGEGVGLLRTELLFMDRDSFPSEDEQFEFYKQVALHSKGKPVIVRTIDIGGDKHLPYFNLPVELNPFLGYRAIRICLDQKDLFITQLKAILRASVFGDLKIMFPMISNIQEIRAAKSILEEAKAKLRQEGVAFKSGIKTGIMIEIPSAAITADLLAKEVDFFSIGTNDLCQYTLAVDRMNEKITHLYDPFNPAILRLISFVIDQGEKHNIHVGMCGEMAGEPLATMLLLGMGLKDFSMSAASIPAVKQVIINNSEGKAKGIWERVKGMDDSADIVGYLKEFN